MIEGKLGWAREKRKLEYSEEKLTFCVVIYLLGSRSSWSKNRLLKNLKVMVSVSNRVGDGMNKQKMSLKT